MCMLRKKEEGDEHDMLKTLLCLALYKRVTDYIISWESRSSSTSTAWPFKAENHYIAV
jgi:hypothetical protein